MGKKIAGETPQGDKINFIKKGMHVLFGAIIIVAVHFLASFVRNGVLKLATLQHRDRQGETRQAMLAYKVMAIFAYWIIMCIGVVMMLRMVGIETASVLALMGTFGFAFSLGMQGALSDFTSGILLSLGGNFAQGDLIEVDDVVGEVQNFNLLYTTIKQNDTYHQVRLPNRLVYGSVMHNHALRPRSIMLTMVISNGNKNVDAVLRKVEQRVSSEKGVIPQPPVHAQIARVHAYGTDIEVRVAIEPRLFFNKDNFNFRNHLTTIIRNTLVENGIELPQFSKHFVPTSVETKGRM